MPGPGPYGTGRHHATGNGTGEGDGRGPLAMAGFPGPGHSTAHDERSEAPLAAGDGGAALRSGSSYGLSGGYGGRHLPGAGLYGTGRHRATGNGTGEGDGRGPWAVAGLPGPGHSTAHDERCASWPAGAPETAPSLHLSGSCLRFGVCWCGGTMGWLDSPGWDLLGGIVGCAWGRSLVSWSPPCPASSPEHWNKLPSYQLACLEACDAAGRLNQRWCRECRPPLPPAARCAAARHGPMRRGGGMPTQA